MMNLGHEAQTSFEPAIFLQVFGKHPFTTNVSLYNCFYVISKPL